MQIITKRDIEPIRPGARIQIKSGEILSGYWKIDRVAMFERDKPDTLGPDLEIFEVRSRALESVPCALDAEKHEFNLTIPICTISSLRRTKRNKLIMRLRGKHVLQYPDNKEVHVPIELVFTFDHETGQLQLPLS